MIKISKTSKIAKIELSIYDFALPIAIGIENQKPTKTKKQALCFCLLFDLFVTSAGLTSLFLCALC